jgi:hypothetical protein
VRGVLHFGPFSPLFTGVRGKKNSRKFAVANGSPTHRQALDNRLCRIRLASKCGDFAPFVAPLCIKWLRLVTTQLPEKFWPLKTRVGRTSS